jgi:cobalt/nickel transport system permease protein
MADGHVHALYRHGDSVLHAMAPQVKIVAAFVFVFAVVAAPREAIWAFAIYAVVLLALMRIGGLGARFVGTRMVVEVPFVLATLLFPFLAPGPTVTVLGIELSTAGLWDMWNIVAKATLGLMTSIVLAGTTQIPKMLAGFDALHVPRVITAIMGFMIRYFDVVLGEFRRMRVAMQSRAYAPRWIGHIRPYAQSAGTIFVRSYERGERVYLAMASRGYTGHMPPATVGAAPPLQWVVGLGFVGFAWAVAITALVTQ